MASGQETHHWGACGRVPFQLAEAELGHFQSKGLPRSAPNTMNRCLVLLGLWGLFYSRSLFGADVYMYIYIYTYIYIYKHSYIDYVYVRIQLYRYKFGHTHLCICTCT